MTRLDAVYHPTHKFDPAGLMALNHFKDTVSGQYVIVEGYVDSLGSKWPQDDKDYHFELQSTKAKHVGVTPDGLVCEIDPTPQLTNFAALKAIHADNPATYRKVRVFGFLRFGTEKSNHSGIHTYSLGNGQTIKGHWEIHPVEKVVTIDNGSPFQIGPTANYVKPVIKSRYKLNDTNFQKDTSSNYGALRGTVKDIRPSANGSGDYDVLLQVNTTKYTATIPEYYVENFDAITSTLIFHSLSFSSIHSLKPDDNAQHTFYGLRNWWFDNGKRVASLQPVEMIK